MNQHGPRMMVSASWAKNRVLLICIIGCNHTSCSAIAERFATSQYPASLGPSSSFTLKSVGQSTIRTVSYTHLTLPTKRIV